MIILGINEEHNSTAALNKDGKIIYCASEERISRIKNDNGYPWQTINNALKETGIKTSQIDQVVYTVKEQDPIALKTKRITRFKISDYIREMHEHWKPILLENKPSHFYENLLKESRFNDENNQYYNFDFIKTTPRNKWVEVFNQERKNIVARQLNINPEKVIFHDHHQCHAYYAYYASIINRRTRAAVITADGWGDGYNATIWLAENGKLKKIFGTKLCNLARIYRFITLLLGMKPFEHEYKVMGLAPYAKNYIAKPAYNVFKKTLIVDGLDFKWQEKPSDLYFYFQKKLEGCRFDGIAAGLQKWTEDLLVEWFSNIVNHLKVDTVAYSGGLSMNVKNNQVINQIPQIKNFFIPPSGGDESTAIGASYIASIEKSVIPIPLSSAYLGYTITNQEIEDLLDNNKIIDNPYYQVIFNVSPSKIASLLDQNKIIARCAGPMEFGARALGNRSIICNPSCFENLRLINEKIKFRDFWMPFTPTILDYRASDYLINPKNTSASFMTIAFDTTSLARQHLAAAIHPYDFTARPQVLTKDINPDYYAIIEAFAKKTGIGGVLNTSLNLHGQPIDRNASDAWHTFTHSDLDAIILNKTLIIKN